LLTDPQGQDGWETFTERKLHNLGFVLKVILFTGRSDNEIRNASRIKGVRMEDLLLEPRNTLEQVGRYLGIHWDDILMETTLDGEMFWYPRPGNEGLLTGFETRVVTDESRRSRLSYLTRFDAFRFSMLMSPKYERWQYDLSPGYRSVLLRFLLLPCLLPTFRMERVIYRERFARQQVMNSLMLYGTLLVLLPVSPVLMVVSLFRRGRRMIQRMLPRQAALWLGVRTTLFRAWALLFERESRDIALLTASPVSGSDGPGG